MIFSERIAECERRWGLLLEAQFGRSLNHVFPAVRDGEPVVLKLGAGGEYGLEREAAGLRLIDGRGAVRLLDHDAELGAMVLERALPGTPLLPTVLTDDVAVTAIAVEVMGQLWRPVSTNGVYEHVADFIGDFTAHRDRFDGSSGTLDARRFDEGERLFAELVASSAEPALLHGDLHHLNILAASRAPWLAVDPKGLVGEPAYETGALLRNPFPELLSMDDPAKITRRRIDQLAEALELDRERIRGWGLAQAVLAAVWSVEDDVPEQEYWMACADLLAQV